MRSGTTNRAPWSRLGALLTALGIVAALGSSGAAAATTWSRTPSAGLGGATIHVASSSDSLCRWSTGTRATGTRSAPVTVDGSRVELRLERPGVTVTLGEVPVTPGGAWAGDFTVPPPDRAPAGDYELIARCVVDDPSLDEARGFDLDPASFGVVESPPPVTVTAAPPVPPSVAATLPTQVAGVEVSRTVPNVAAASTPTLPRTGGGTLAVGLAGAAAVLVGGLALWWGARAARRAHLDTR